MATNHVITAIHTARMLDRLLPLMGDEFIERFEESVDGSIAAIDGYEAELGRIIDHTSEEEYEAGSPSLAIWRAEEATAAVWLVSVRASLANAIVEG